MFGDERADELLARYHEVEPELQRSGDLTYREVLTEAMRRLGAAAGEEHGLAESLPGWRAFPEVHASLGELRRRGWKLAILSNTDDDFVAACQFPRSLNGDPQCTPVKVCMGDSSTVLAYSRP